MRETYWTFDNTNYVIIESKGGIRKPTVRIFRIIPKRVMVYYSGGPMTTQEAIKHFFNGRHTSGITIDEIV